VEPPKDSLGIRVPSVLGARTFVHSLIRQTFIEPLLYISMPQVLVYKDEKPDRIPIS
jgi:hypothetical protein